MDGIIGGSKLSEKESLDMKNRWKNLGSAMSTNRMLARFAAWINHF